VPPISSDKLNWKHCSKNKKESVSYPRRKWNRLWKQCTKLRGNTRQTSWIVKDVRSFHIISVKATWPLWNDRTFRDFTPFCCKTRFWGEIIEKVMESRYIGHFLIIGQIINIDLILPLIIGDSKDLSAKLSISKIYGKLSKNLTYRPPLFVGLDNKGFGILEYFELCDKLRYLHLLRQKVQSCIKAR